MIAFLFIITVLYTFISCVILFYFYIQNEDFPFHFIPNHNKEAKVNTTEEEAAGGKQLWTCGRNAFSGLFTRWHT